MLVSCFFLRQPYLKQRHHIANPNRHAKDAREARYSHTALLELQRLVCTRPSAIQAQGPLFP